MLRYHIVTDSSAHFSHPQLIAQLPVTIVPNHITIAGQTYREGVDLAAEKAIEQIAHQVTPPVVLPPSVDDFATVFAGLAKHTDVILSIHSSRDLSKSWEHGRLAAEQLEGHAHIEVIDSRSMDGAQGMVVRAAVRAIEQGSGLEQIVRQVRGATERVYAVYAVETTDYLMRNGIMTPSHAILSAMTDMMPILAIEDGQIVTIEKVRTRNQALDRLIEFVSEFADIEDVLILQHRSYMSEQTRALQDRLAVEFPKRHFPHTVYSPSLAALIGADATGLVVLESDEIPPEDEL